MLALNNENRIMMEGAIERNKNFKERLIIKTFKEKYEKLGSMKNASIVKTAIELGQDPSYIEGILKKYFII